MALITGMLSIDDLGLAGSQMETSINLKCWMQGGKAFFTMLQ